MFKKPKHIIVIIADSLRHQSVFKSDPGIPYISKNATCFNQARSAGCWTLPSTASIFTGLLPHQHGATSQTRGIRKDIPTLAEKLKLEGYKTYQVTANVATTDIFGLHRGFDAVYRSWDFSEAKFKYLTQLLVLVGKPRLRKSLFSKDFLMQKMSNDLKASKTWMQYMHQDSFNLARSIMNHHQKKNESCFLFINLMETHFPYHVAPTFECLSEGIFDRANELLSLYKTINQSFLKTGKLGINAKGLETLKSRQRKSWENIAPKVDAFVEEMHHSGENLIVFASDHGENFGEQNWMYHFSNVTDAGTKVPLFWLPPGQSDSKEVNSHISLRNIHQLITNAVSKGSSDIDILEKPEGSTTVSESYWYNNNGKTLADYRFNQFAFVENDEKFINRNGKWYKSGLSNGENESNMEEFDNSTEVFSKISDTDKRNEIRGLSAEFEKFCKKIPFE